MIFKTNVLIKYQNDIVWLSILFIVFLIWLTGFISCYIFLNQS